MAELLKNIYNDDFFNRFTESMIEVYPSFNKTTFLTSVYNSDWDSLELKGRMRHITIALNEQLSTDYSTNLDIIISSIPLLVKNGFKTGSLEFIFYPDFVELYGINSYQESVNALEEITKFITCEFAVRPFLIKYPTEMMEKMLLWSTHKNYHVRRLSSEGSRPSLPWAMALPRLKKDPSSIFPILENLKNDEHEYVRRSVANNLNDISKFYPNKVIEIAKNWIGINNKTEKLVKHATRTLLKQGNLEVMELFGFGAITQLKIADLSTSTPKVSIGEYLQFNFNLINNNPTPTKIRLEYGIYYLKANGTLTRKVFKISEKEYLANSTTLITKKQSFKIITTRKFHIGNHQVSVIVNGRELEKIDFDLQ